MLIVTMLHSNLQKAKADSKQDYQLSRELESLFSLQNTEPEKYIKKVDNNFENIDKNDLIYSYLIQLRNWEDSNHTDFQNGIGGAISNIDDILEEVLENGWLNVASLFLQEKITRPEQLGGHSGADGTNQAIQFFEDYLHEDSLSSRNKFQLASCVIAHTDYLSKKKKKSFTDTCLKIAEELIDCGRLPQARELLVEVESVSDEIEYRHQDIQDLIIEVVELYIDNVDSYEIKSLFLEYIVSNYSSILTEEAKNQWQQSIKDYNKQVRKDNKRSMKIDKDKILADVQQLLSTYENISDNRTYPVTFSALLLSDLGIISSAPDDQFYSENLRRMISPEGDSVAVSDVSKIPKEEYLTYTQLSNLILYEFLNSLFERRLVTESQLYLLINTLPGANDDDKAYLTDILINYFEGRYPEVIHMAIPRFESLVTNAFQEYGEPVTKTTIGREFEQQTFGGLLTKFEEEINKDLGRYYRYRYTEKGGMNVRNRVSHGQTDYRLCSKQNATVLLFDMLRAPVQIGDRLR